MIMLPEYFHRIGYSGSQEPTYDTLRAIQAAQSYTIPFETFDIAMGRPILLTIDGIFKKLVREKRGGYCYEVNGLLHYVLDKLGFKTRLCLARLADDKGDLLAASVHMVIVVAEKWLVDVGWGKGFVEPFELDSESVVKDGEGYSFFQNGKRLHHFTLENHPLAFFETRNSYHQTSPKSLFASQIFCSMPTPEGFVSMQGGTFVQKIAGEKKEHIVSSDSEYRKLLQSAFGLNLEVKKPLRYEHEGFILHFPRNKSDWDAYHRIRFEQIHTRYCPELTYNPDDPEEKGQNNFPFVLRKDGQDEIVGTIRIDLLAESEASFRWIAVDTPHVRQGFGTKMVQAAEQFVQEHKRSTIRIPATAQSLAFASRLGYSQEPWALMPQEACMIAVCKRL